MLATFAKEFHHKCLAEWWIRRWKVLMKTEFSLVIFFQFSLPRNIWFLYPWIQDVSWTHTRRSEDLLELFWTSYVRSIYVLWPGGKEYFLYYSCSENWIKFLGKMFYATSDWIYMGKGKQRGKVLQLIEWLESL